MYRGRFREELPFHPARVTNSTICQTSSGFESHLADDTTVKRSNFETLPRRANLDIPRPISVDAPHFYFASLESVQKLGRLPGRAARASGRGAGFVWGTLIYRLCVSGSPSTPSTDGIVDRSAVSRRSRPPGQGSLPVASYAALAFRPPMTTRQIRDRVFGLAGRCGPPRSSLHHPSR
jgi:hypothetical protein